MVVTELLPAEVRRIAALAPEVPDAGAAVAEVAVAFAVYRSYLPTGAAISISSAAGRASPSRAGGHPARLAPRLHDPATSWPAGCSN